MPRIIMSFLCVALSAAQVQAQESALARFQKLRQAAVEAQRKGEFARALENYLRLLEMVPEKPDINYLAAVAEAKLGEADKGHASIPHKGAPSAGQGHPPSPPVLIVALRAGLENSAVKPEADYAGTACPGSPSAAEAGRQRARG